MNPARAICVSVPRSEGDEIASDIVLNLTSSLAEDKVLRDERSMK